MIASVLPFEEVRFIKRISVEIVRHEEPFFGEIIYVRKASMDYWYKPVPTDLSWKERFEREVNGRPEDEFPSDILDKLILKGIRTVFPQANTMSKGIVFDVDRDEIKKYLSRRNEVKQNLMIMPNAAGIPMEEMARYAGKEYQGYSRQLSLFCIEDKAQAVFSEIDYNLYYSISIAPNVDELLDLYDKEVFGMEAI